MQRKKKCKVCKGFFIPEREMQTICSFPCSLTYARQKAQKNAEGKKKKARKALKQFNDSDKTVLKRNLQMLVNKYARLRDQYNNGYRCCTCSTTTGKMDGGHFLPTSGYSAIRYNINQIHQQCVGCNQYRSGMPKEYRVFMIDKYGLEYVEKLEATKGVLRGYSVEYYQRLIKILRKKIRRVEAKLK